MISDHQIEIGDVEYSKLSHVLRFTTACNAEAIAMIEDVVGRTDMSMEEIADEMRKIFENAIHMAYHRGGLRRKYD